MAKLNKKNRKHFALTKKKSLVRLDPGQLPIVLKVKSERFFFSGFFYLLCLFLVLSLLIWKSTSKFLFRFCRKWFALTGGPSQLLLSFVAFLANINKKN